MHFVVTKWRTVSFSTFILWVLFTSLCFFLVNAPLRFALTYAGLFDTYICCPYYYLTYSAFIQIFSPCVIVCLNHPVCTCLYSPASCFVLTYTVPSSNTSIHQMLWWLKIIIRIWGIKSHVIYSNKWCRCLYLYWSTVVKFWLLLEIRNFNTKI